MRQRKETRALSVSTETESALVGGRRRRLVVGRLFELMEARATVDAGRREQIWLHREKDRGRCRIVVEMLDHDAVALGRQVEHVARLPRMLDAVEQRGAAARDDEHDLPALEFQPPR